MRSSSPSCKLHNYIMLRPQPRLIQTFLSKDSVESRFLFRCLDWSLRNDFRELRGPSQDTLHPIGQIVALQQILMPALSRKFPQIGKPVLSVGRGTNQESWEGGPGAPKNVADILEHRSLYTTQESGIAPEPLRESTPWSQSNARTSIRLLHHFFTQLEFLHASFLTGSRTTKRMIAQHSV